MKVITVGSFKGGTGKTTLSAVLGTALSLRGIKTWIVELDPSTRPLARFEASRHFADLQRPEIRDLDMSGGAPDVVDWKMAIRNEKKEAQRLGAEIIIIDTTSVWKPEVIAAHLSADLIITTVTESPIDLYQLMPGDGPNMQTVRPYAQLIDLVQRHAAKTEKTNLEWMMCLNRRSHLYTKVGERVREQLQTFAEDSGISILEGLVDRVGYRNMMATGVTPLDETPGEPTQKSLIAARHEANQLTCRVLSALKLESHMLEREVA